MQSLLIAGAGQIGSLLAQLLADCGRYHVYLLDADAEQLKTVQRHDNLTKQSLDVMGEGVLADFIGTQQIHAVVACLPYFCNIHVAEVAKQTGVNYFDLTEDVRTVKAVTELSQDESISFTPRCGVAPGFINMIANDIAKEFDRLDTIKLRCGCLPKHSSNSLKYALAWSIDGLINEYGNTCYGLHDGEITTFEPLHDLETIELDGVIYEAFNTSGGVGALPELYAGKVKTLNYKSMRYPGHCDKMRFLMEELHLNDDRDTLKRLMINALPRTDQDVMIIYVSVSGHNNGDFFERNYVNKIYPQDIFGRRRSAIQIATAHSAAAVIDTVQQDAEQYSGFVYQEKLPFDVFMANEFAQVLHK